MFVNVTKPSIYRVVVQGLLLDLSPSWFRLAPNLRIFKIPATKYRLLKIYLEKSQICPFRANLTNFRFKFDIPGIPYSTMWWQSKTGPCDEMLGLSVNADGAIHCIAYPFFSRSPYFRCFRGWRSVRENNMTAKSAKSAKWSK